MSHVHVAIYSIAFLSHCVVRRYVFTLFISHEGPKGE